MLSYLIQWMAHRNDMYSICSTSTIKSNWISCLWRSKHRIREISCIEILYYVYVFVCACICKSKRNICQFQCFSFSLLSLCLFENHWFHIRSKFFDDSVPVYDAWIENYSIEITLTKRSNENIFITYTTVNCSLAYIVVKINSKKKTNLIRVSIYGFHYSSIHFLAYFCFIKTKPTMYLWKFIQRTKKEKNTKIQLLLVI